jgi:stress-induced-phosphoprotein 1
MSDEKEKGNKAFKDKNYDLAIRHYDEAIKKDPKNPVYYSNKATCYYQMENYKDSLTCVYKTIEIDPNFTKSIQNTLKTQSTFVALFV